MTLRQATPSDALAIAQVQVDTWHTTYTGLVPQEMLDQLSVSKRTEVWTDIISQGRTTTFVVEHNCAVVGFLNLGPTRDDDKDPEQTGEVLAIYIDKAHQGTGKGRELFAKAIEFFREEGFSTFSLWVLDSNQGARDFYERMNMRQDGCAKTELKGTVTLNEVRYVGKI